MNDEVKRITDGLQKAIQAEQEGRHFYMMAARNTEDPKGKEVFQALADEELKHFHYLQRQYKSIMETGKVDPTAKLGRKTEWKGSHPIFSDAIKNRIGEAHYEMTALSIGEQLEMSAVNFYTAEAQINTDPAIKSFYMELAEWERGHLHALQAEAESLKEDYWNKGGFAPF